MTRRAQRADNIVQDAGMLRGVEGLVAMIIRQAVDDAIGIKRFQPRPGLKDEARQYLRNGDWQGWVESCGGDVRGIRLELESRYDWMAA